MNRSLLALIKINLFEIINDKFFWILLFAGFFLQLVSLVVGELSFAEQVRLVVHFGLLATQLCTLAIVAFLAPSNWRRDIDRKSILMILSRPIPRSVYLIAKFFSLLIVTILILISLLLLVVVINPGKLSLVNMLHVYLGFFLEATILLAFSLFALQFLRPILATLFTLTLFLSGHWVEEVRLFAIKTNQELMILICQVLDWIIPNFYRMNFKSIYYAESGVDSGVLVWASGYNFGWILLFLSLAVLIFKGRDLV